MNRRDFLRRAVRLAALTLATPAALTALPAGADDSATGSATASAGSTSETGPQWHANFNGAHYFGYAIRPSVYRVYPSDRIWQEPWHLSPVMVDDLYEESTGKSRALWADVKRRLSDGPSQAE